MAKSFKQNLKSRWKRLNVAEGREKRRIARLDKIYRPDREHHEPLRNPRYKARGKPKGESRVMLPKHLDFYTPENSAATLAVLESIRESLLKLRHKKVVLDHRGLETLAPEAALVLLAEIQRCRVYCDTRTKLTGTYPRSPEVSRLLVDIGFYESLGIHGPSLPKALSDRKYVKIERHNKTLSVVVDNLLSCFEEEVNFAADGRKRLQVALIECMDNVFEHAYAVKSSDPYLYREWWMLGYSDHADGSISFSFYDQGAGISSTIKEKLSRRIVDRLRGWSDGAWLERGVRKPISRHESSRRGHGLNKLKNFIDSSDIEAKLRVIANKGDVEFPAAGKPLIRDLKVPLNGTLIVWTLRPKTSGGAATKRLVVE